jgi:hypothetical protein
MIHTLHLLIWVIRLWPPVLALSVSAFRWHRTRHRIALAVLGTAAGYGVQQIVGQILVQLPLDMPSGTDDLNQALLRAFLTNGWRNVVLSVICSVPLVLWLHRITGDSTQRQ